MKQTVYTNIEDLAESFGLPREYGIIVKMKTKLTGEIINTAKKEKLTHQKIADLSGVPRSAVTGIINGSLQKVTLDRLVRILNSLGKNIDIKVTDIAA